MCSFLGHSHVSSFEYPHSWQVQQIPCVGFFIRRIPSIIPRILSRSRRWASATISSNILRTSLFDFGCTVVRSRMYGPSQSISFPLHLAHLSPLKCFIVLQDGQSVSGQHTSQRLPSVVWVQECVWPSGVSWNISDIFKSFF